MNVRDAENWFESNQRYLMAAVGEVRARLIELASSSDEERAAGPRRATGPRDAPDAPAAGTASPPEPPALEVLCQLFGLSPFERGILVLCAGIELDGSLAGLCAAAQGDPRRPYPTFGLAIAALPDAHWSALAPDAPLRDWRLVELEAGAGLTDGALRIDERVLHYLTGVQPLDPRLAGYVEPLEVVAELVPSHRALVERIVSTWTQAGDGAPLPAIQLCGRSAWDQWAIASAACQELGVDLHLLHATALPADPRELAALRRLWEREAAFSPSALLLDCHLPEGPQGGDGGQDAAREEAVERFVEGVFGALLVASSVRRANGGRTLLTLEVDPPTGTEQCALWRRALGPRAAALDGQVDALVAQFCLDASTIRTVAAVAPANGTGDEGFGEALWDACRVQARPQLDDLAQRIAPVARWADLVLPEMQKDTLRQIAAHVRQRTQVYERWGFAAQSSRGLGISALFSGASGTGKTMAAEVLANELRLDLYRIDLSQVVSKYIGETEKNLRRLFDAAESSGAILLFDEADALFGKRSEVRDSHDRYANIEISYLLQRMEAYRGLAILTTNMGDALDTAFMRRIRFIVHFPFPNRDQRAEIWRGIYPRETPITGLDADKLAQLNVAGGHIRNIAMYAAFLAADEGAPVRMAHLLAAARAEYTKLEKALTEGEIRGWV